MDIICLMPFKTTTNTPWFTLTKSDIETVGHTFKALGYYNFIYGNTKDQLLGTLIAEIIYPMVGQKFFNNFLYDLFV